MVEIVINYSEEEKVYKVYEPTSDTLLVTESLADSLLKLSQFLKDSGLIGTDILQDSNISYHLDSATMQAMIESNVNLMKRLNNGPSGFMISSQRFGSSLGSSKKTDNFSSGNGNKDKKRKGSGMFSNSNFKGSYKKFGGLSNF